MLQSKPREVRGLTRARNFQDSIDIEVRLEVIGQGINRTLDFAFVIEP